MTSFSSSLLSSPFSFPLICFHSPATDLETKKCQDAAAKGIEIVDEDWVRERCEDDDDDFTYVDEMLDLGEDETLHHPPFSKKAIGMQLTVNEYASNEELDQDAIYVVLAFKQVGEEEVMKIKKMDDEDAEILEVGEDELYDDFRVVVPPRLWRSSGTNTKTGRSPKECGKAWWTPPS